MSRGAPLRAPARCRDRERSGDQEQLAAGRDDQEQCPVVARAAGHHAAGGATASTRPVTMVRASSSGGSGPCPGASGRAGSA